VNRVVTIGVYEWDLRRFLAALRAAEVRVLLDVRRRNRAVLADVYREGYTREILDRADLRPIVGALPADGAGALFCVEADPEACHRSLIAERMAGEFGVEVSHLRPSR
jgi:hypothetical protein